MKLFSITLAVFVLCQFVLTGCDSPKAVSGSSPHELMNPAMSEAQKARTIKRKQEMGDLPGNSGPK